MQVQRHIAGGMGQVKTDQHVMLMRGARQPGQVKQLTTGVVNARPQHQGDLIAVVRQVILDL